MRTDTPQPIRLIDYRAPDFRIPSTELSFDLHPTQTRVKAKLSVERQGAKDAPLVLMGERLKLISVALDGRLLSPDAYAVTDETLSIAEVPDAFTLETKVEIDPSNNTTLEGLYMSSGRFCTQCEAEGFRKITYSFDRPDALSTYRVRIEAPKAGFPHLLSNGNLIERGDLDNGRHFAQWEDPFFKPCYLFALVAGDLDVFEDSFVTMTGRTVDLKIYVDTGMRDRAAYAMDALKRSMRWDEEAYGREYDLDLFMIVAVRDFNFGAMENKGLNIFNASLLLADPQTATDADYERIESVIAHEYFHNWSGNRVTCRDWFQLCLKEGLTVFRDQGFSGDQRGHAVARIKDVKALRARQFAEDSGPLAHPVRPSSYLKIDNFYTATIYEKGAEIVGMLKTYVGPETYRKALDHYFAANDGTAATLEDFLASFEAVTGESFKPWLTWYTQAGTPRLHIAPAYDASAKTLSLTLTQATAPTPGQPDKTTVPIPVRFGLLNADGEAQGFTLDGESLTEALYVLRDAEAVLTLHDVAEPPVLSALRHFSAPVILSLKEDPDAAFARMKGDPDPFNRWEAAQGLARDLILSGDLTHAPRFGDALQACLNDDALEPAFQALMLALPSESDLAQAKTPVNPQALHHNRQALKAALSQQLDPILRATYAAIPLPNSFSPDARAAGQRSLRNALLDLIMAGYSAAPDRPERLAMAQAHVGAADTMTDMIGGLSALAYAEPEAFDTALAAFYERFKTEPLVIDKWFALQAGTPNADPQQTRTRARRLTQHPDFDPKTPNRWRAVVQAFAGNPAAFHAEDGSGYDLLVEQVLMVDAFNPMTAARLVEPLSRFRIYESPWREAMQAALTRIRNAPGLSKNVLELSAKALED
ncbi:MAG: aminopeptidase N [Asticcacaulis sp.]|uniref:aminopeptidase N n=1 Tax=Asticcacaulis sp. TaxID=1872648 RepID=UPI003F7C40A2